MTLGEKIKSVRIKKGMTQSQLCSDKITRNMLSIIECGKALPSLDTLYYIAERLEIPVAYLVSEDSNPFLFEKERKISKIREALSQKQYKTVLWLTESLSEIDDELAYILSYSHLCLGKDAVLRGALESGKKHISAAEKYASQTVYDTTFIKHSALLYGALSTNLQAPLLVLDIDKFENNILSLFDQDLFKYLSFNENHQYKNPFFSKHVRARALMKKRDYRAALSLMREIEEEKTPENYNAYTVFSIYTDIETCYKQLGDFENAYRYATKRLSLIEGFKS